MKVGWTKTTLGEAFTTSTGSTPPKSNSDFYGQFMPLVKPPELCDSTLDSAEDGLSEAGAQVARTLPPKSILVSCIGNLGKIGMNTVPVAFNQQINAIHPDAGKAVPEFMFFQTLSGQFRAQLEAMASGTTVPIVNKSKFNSIEIVLPPLPEQQRIVTLLDEAFDGIATAKAHAEKNLQNARAIFESHLQSVFSQRRDGWTEKRLADVTTIINGFAFKSGDFSPHAKVQSIKITNVGVREFVCESDSLLPTDFAETYASFSIRSGSIVIALTRTIISDGLKVAIVPDKFDGALLNQRVAAILVSPNLLNTKFLFAYLSSQYVFDYVKAHVNTLMQPNLSINDLRAMPIPLPPAIEQARIAARLEALKEETQRLESIYQQKITALEYLKKSLLHRAFNGDL